MGNLTQLAITRKPAPKFCQFSTWVLDLDKEDQATVVSILKDPSWTIQAVLNLLREEGCPSGEKAIYAHRRGTCSMCGLA